jgi:hypothetical protein
VAQRRREARTQKPALGYLKAGGGECSRVRFAYVKPGVTPKPAYELAGVRENGRKETVDLGVLDALTVIRRQPERHRVLCTLTRFPDITPEALVRDQPSYSVLERDHRKGVRLWIDTGTPARGKLTLIGSSDPDQDLADVRVPFAALPLNQPVRFNVMGPGRSDLARFRGTYWWAIPSVTEDRRYPNRLFTGA